MSPRWASMFRIKLEATALGQGYDYGRLWKQKCRQVKERDSSYQNVVIQIFGHGLWHALDP